MIEQACRELGLDPARSFMVGDRLDRRGVRPCGGRAVGAGATGHGAHEAEAPRRAVASRMLSSTI